MKTKETANEQDKKTLEYSHIEKMLKEKAEQIVVPPFEEVWKRVKDKVHPPKAKP